MAYSFLGTEIVRKLTWAAHGTPGHVGLESHRNLLVHSRIVRVQQGRRIYRRVSTEAQDLARQANLVQSTRAAAIYRQTVSGARTDKSELLRLIADLREVVIAWAMDRITGCGCPMQTG